ncbi:hypothetical protein E4U57_005015 [Claviceps arundinis]|uniref:Uncharacterized protein n=1 Tax=Claviceps arundinis TaxID=1623583 RepID=A0A9P7MXC1_9HYPO|nr:hypothetical protein E4U57_005015 [Claviceps arundinis]KAG5975466.1 hypothetical protein E4U56_003666 [Claviceps arundinis]
METMPTEIDTTEEAALRAGKKAKLEDKTGKVKAVQVYQGELKNVETENIEAENATTKDAEPPFVEIANSRSRRPIAAMQTSAGANAGRR